MLELPMFPIYTDFKDDGGKMGEKPTIGSIVARLRRRRGLSQIQIQEITKRKITQSWLTDLETGRIKHSTPGRLELLASVLGTTKEHILSEAQQLDLAELQKTGNVEIDALAKVYYSLPPEMRPIALKIMRDLAAAESIEEGDAREERKSKAA